MDMVGIVLPSGRITDIPGVYPNGGPGGRVAIPTPFSIAFDPDVTQFATAYIMAVDGSQGYGNVIVSDWIANSDQPVSWSWQVTNGTLNNCTTSIPGGGAPYTSQPVTMEDTGSTNIRATGQLTMPWGGVGQTFTVAITASNGSTSETISQDILVVQAPFNIQADPTGSYSFDGDQLLDSGGNPVADNAIAITVRIFRRLGMTDPIDVTINPNSDNPMLSGNGDSGDLGGVSLVQWGSATLAGAPDEFTLNYVCPTAAAFTPFNASLFATTNVSTPSVPGEPSIFNWSSNFTGWQLSS
jgi:hypothetical protein